MHSSTIIEFDGIFLGTAIRVPGIDAPRFYATHDSVRALHNSILPDLASLRRRVTAHFLKSRRAVTLAA